MLSFIEYASEKRILELLIKERVKAAIKSKLKDVDPVDTLDKSSHDIALSTAEQLMMIMPARDTWHRPQKRDRIQKDSREKKSTKQVLTRSVALTIRKHRKNAAEHPYLQRLDAFIAMIRNDIAGNAPLEFTSIKISGKKKKETDVIIMRPICAFDSLREKLLIALANKYLSEVFDPLLHEEILSYRPLRLYHNSATPVLTDRDNAIENLQAYRNAHRQQRIYVTECDIQKYFDTINHDVIRRCFSKFAQKIKAQHPEFEYSQVERIVEAYLDSYSFYKNIRVKNTPVLERLKKQKEPAKTEPTDQKEKIKKARIYEEPDSKLFVERGCYSQEEFNASTDRIGIPQGGALSGLISNVVLSTIDNESILAKPDKNRFFCRYGDDIILMHTSKAECERLIGNYCSALTENKLLYHNFASVADAQYRKNDGTTRPALWDMKSRSPFLWGRCNDDKEQVDWIGFLGYEIRYTGEVRIRRSSLNDKLKKIKRKYRTGAKTKVAKGKSTKELDKEILNRIERFKSDDLAAAKSLNRNRYCMTQVLKLDKYAGKMLYRLLYKIACNNNLGKDELEYWWRTAKEQGCINYRKTYKSIS